MISNQKTWHIRYLGLARETSSWSKDPSTQVGAVAINPSTGAILSLGYNGFPRGVDDSEDRLNDRSTKLKHMVHAEMNAIYNACLNGVPLRGSHLYIHGLPPCSECVKGIIQVGVQKVIIWDEPIPPAWIESCAEAEKMLKEAGVCLYRSKKDLQNSGNTLQ
jgi:dCMP deaminase